MATSEGSRVDGVEDSFPGRLERARRGSSEAMGELIWPLRDGLKADAARQLGVRLRPKADASDIVNQAFCEAVVDFEKFEGNERNQFRSWVRTILKNTVKNLGRFHGAGRRDYRREQSIGSGIERVDRPEAGPSPSSVVGLMEWREIVWRTIDRLSDDHREVIRLRYESKLELREVARRMDRSVDATKQLWARAIKALASELKKHPRG